MEADKRFIRRLKKVLVRVPAARKFLDLLNVYEFRKQLSSIGWLSSRMAGESRDRAGNPIPWITYPSLAFLEPRLIDCTSVFEYGSGNSTKWLAGRFAHVVSCEHDLQWFEKMRPELPTNVEYLYRPLDGKSPYALAIENCSTQFEMIVIDGRNRIACTKNCLSALAPDGVILFDNSDREKYQEAYDFLKESGFRRLDFWGSGPIAPYQWCTSIFYRDDNFLGI